MSTCYVYTWHHSNEADYWGFYNLCVWGSYVVGGRTLVNPVFSYCPDSKLRIYPHGKMSRHYPATEWPSGYDLWRFTFYAPDAANFISTIGSVMDTANMSPPSYNSSTDYYMECNLKQYQPDGSTNPFYQYDASRYNCFAAVATWVKWLGVSDANNKLLEVYNNAHNPDTRYLEYIPAAMYAKYGSSWQLTSFPDPPNTP